MKGTEIIRCLAVALAVTFCFVLSFAFLADITHQLEQRSRELDAARLTLSLRRLSRPNPPPVIKIPNGGFVLDVGPAGVTAKAAP